MDEGLKIVIGADVSGLEKGVNQATQSLNKLKPAVAQTGTTLTNLSRIAQDAPFGFIAIQNNLDPLIQSFQQLSKQSGGTGAAIKSLAAGLAGPAGLALGFSLVASLATSLIQKYGSLRGAVAELAAATDRASVRQRELNNELDKGLASQQGEITTLNNLVKVLTDSNASQLQRTNAYKELKKEYPGVLQSMTEENALTLSGGKLIAARSAQLVNYIKLKSQEAALIKLGEKAAEKQLTTAREGLTTFQNQNTILNTLINTIAGQGNAALGAAIRVQQAGKEFDKAGDDVDFFAQALENVQRQLLNFDPKLTGLEKITPPKKITVRPVELEVLPQKVSVGNTLTGSDAELLRNFRIDNGLDIPLNLTVPQAAFDTLKKFGVAAKDALDTKNLAIQAAEFKQILTEGLAQPLGDIIFNFLDQGKLNFKAFADAAITSIKRIVAQLLTTKIIQLLGNLAFPGVGGAATGGFFSSLLGGIGNNANLGGLSSQGLAVNVGGTFNIRGTDLVAVVQSGNQRIGRVG